jgi:hypothetical protein
VKHFSWGKAKRYSAPKAGSAAGSILYMFLTMNVCMVMNVCSRDECLGYADYFVL